MILLKACGWPSCPLTFGLRVSLPGPALLRGGDMV
jgi:hypothetical protein